MPSSETHVPLRVLSASADASSSASATGVPAQEHRRDEEDGQTGRGGERAHSIRNAMEVILQEWKTTVKRRHGFDSRPGRPGISPSVVDGSPGRSARIGPGLEHLGRRGARGRPSTSGPRARPRGLERPAGDRHDEDGFPPARRAWSEASRGGSARQRTGRGPRPIMSEHRRRIGSRCADARAGAGRAGSWVRRMGRPAWSPASGRGSGPRRRRHPARRPASRHDRRRNRSRRRGASASRRPAARVRASGSSIASDDWTFRPTVVVRRGTSQGSGTIIASVDGETLVLTAAHVVRRGRADRRRAGPI